MLALSRTKGQSVTIRTSEGPVVVTVFKVVGGKVKLAFDAPKNVPIVRSEIDDGRHGEIVKPVKPDDFGESILEDYD